MHPDTHGLLSSVDGDRQHPLTSLYEMIRYVRFMYICDLANVWCPHTSYGVHSPHTSFFSCLLSNYIVYYALWGHIYIRTNI